MKKIFITFFIIVCSISLAAINIIVDASESIAYQIGGEVETTKKLSDNNNFNRYNLYEFLEGGYLIFDTINNDICEYSLESPSPYKDHFNNLYYFGPTTYSYKNENKLFNICNGYKESNYADLKIAENRKDTTSISVNNYSNSKSSDIFKIPYSYYFELLDDINNDFPSNLTGDCGYVAATIILSYYDTFYNDNFISDTYMRKANNTSFNYNEWTKVPCATYSFKNLLHTYHDNNSTTAYSITTIINSYMLNNVSPINYHVELNTVPIFTDIVLLLRNNFPVILFGNYNYINNNNDGNVSLHAITAYGYDFSRGYILAHFGWKGYSSVWVNYGLISGSIIGTSYQMYLNDTSHSHSSNFTVSDEEHAYCPVDNVHVSNFNYLYDPYSTMYHTVRCSCNFSIGIEEHEYLSPLSTINQTLAIPVISRVCKKCGYTNSTIS